jgi:hypothetical protein
MLSAGLISGLKSSRILLNMIRKYAAQKFQAPGLILTFLCLIPFLAAACSGPMKGLADEDRTSTPAAGAEQPTSTTLPTLRPNRVFLAGEVSPSSTVWSPELESALLELGREKGMDFQAVGDESQLELIDGDAVLFLGGDDAVLDELASGHPGAKFLTFTQPGTTRDNVYSISLAPERKDVPAFLAGVISALITADWRVGIISVAGEDPSREVDAFYNGARYFCGLCRQAYPPYYDYPMVIELQERSPEALMSAMAELRSMGVETIYFATSVLGMVQEASPEAGMRYLAGFDPPPAFAPLWVVTIAPDPERSLREAWNRAWNGEEVGSAGLVFQLRGANPAFLSEGRENFVLQVLADLNSGMIQTTRE